jgi:hypothetical protein
MATVQRPGRRAPAREALPDQPVSDERRLREERLLDAAATLLVRWG